MKIFQYFCIALLVVLALPVNAQQVDKTTVLGAITLSGSLVACGYSQAGADFGLKLTNLLPAVGLNDKSPEVAKAFIKGTNAVKNREVSCSDVVKYAKAAGMAGLD